MRHLAITKTVDLYPGLTSQQRKELQKEDAVIEKMKKSICEAFGFTYCGFSPNQVKNFHSEIYG